MMHGQRNIKLLKNTTDTPRLTKFQVTQFHTYKSFIKEVKNIKSYILENRAEFFIAQMQAQWDESGGKNTAGW